LSDSVANLTVKVDTKSVSAAVQALDKLAAVAAKVEESLKGIGGKAPGLGRGAGGAEEGAKKSERALAKMEKRLEDGAKKYEQITRLVNKYALSEGMRADTMNRVNRAFEQYNRVAGNVNATTIQMDRATRRYNQAIEQTKTGIDSVIKLENQRNAERRKSEREQDAATKAAEKARQQEIKDTRALERVLQQAQTRVSGISLRASRQTPLEQAFRIDDSAQRALNQYASTLKQYGTGSLQAETASGKFNRSMQALSNEIAKTGGLLTRVSDNARVFSAAFGAANASLGGFSRVAFNTSAALSALSGTLALREIIQAGLEIDKFVNTLKTVSEGSLGFQRNLNFLFEEANRVGFAVGDVGNSFARLSLAMKGAGFQGAETREVFSELVAASRNFGLSSAETMGVIRALEQSMSKGKFMAEEVRNQMGDRLPVAMAALERAVTKVDGKQSDLNKRFEEGTIDTKRYAVEFVRQIYAMSGGAETLNRTSQSVGSAFGRLTTELTKTNMLFKEAGFDEALISTTDQIRKLIETARESGAVEVLAKSLVTLANNLDLVAGALTAFAAVGFVRILTALASKWVAIGLAVAAVGAGIAGLMRGPARDLDQFDKTVKQFDKTYANLSERINAVNASLISGTSRAASSAESDFEKLITSYRKLGYEASKALVMALKVQEEEAKRSVKELETRIEEAQNRLSSIMPKAEFFQVVSFLQTAAGALPAYNTQILKAVENLNTWYESVKKGEMPLADFVEKLSKIQSEMQVIIEKTPDGSGALSAFSNAAANFIKIIQSPVNLQNIGNAISEVLRLTGLLGTAQQGLQSLTSLRQNIEGGRPLEAIPPVENLPMAPGSRTRLNFSGYVSVKEAQDLKAGEQVLQDAYRRTNKDAKAVVNTTLYLEQVREAARLGDVNAIKIYADYNAALAKNDTKITGTEKSLRKYTETLQIELDTHQGLLEAYKQSTLAGDDMEVQIKAQTKALDYGTKGSIEYKNALAAILPLMRQRSDQEKDTEAVKANTKQREQEISLLEKERSLIGMNINLREQELAAFRARQQNEGRAPDVILAAEDQARKIVRIRQETDQLDNSYKEMANIGVRAFEQVGDAITEAFAKGEIRALNFGNVIRGVMSSIVQSILRLGVINPIINSIFSGTMLPTLGAGLSILGGGGAAAAGAAGAAAGGGGILSSLGQLTGLSNLLPSGGLSGMMASANSYLFGTPASMAIVDPTGIPSAVAGTSGLLGSGGSMSLGALGAGFGVGMFTNSLLGGNQLGGGIGSGVGSLAGMALGSMIGMPFLGAILGGAAGGGLGGLIGPKPSSKGFSYALRSQDGQLAMTDTYYNEQGRAQFEEANTKIPAINAYLRQRGLTVSGVRAVGGNKYGMGNLGYGEAASFNEALGSLKFAATANEELNKALSTRSFAGPEKLQEFVDGFIALQDTIKGLTADPVPEFKKQMDALIDSFAQATAKAREYGIGEEELLAARDKQIAKLEEQRSLTIRDTALEMHVRRLMAEGMDQEAQRIELAYKTQKEIESFTASLDALGISAEEKSRLLVELERTQAAERVKILKDANKNIRDYLDSLRTSSPLSGTTTMGRLGAAQELFNRDLAAAQTGNVDALNRITQSADTLLNLAREVYASTGGFHDIRGRVVSGLESLATTPMSQQSLPDLASVPLVAEMTNLRTNAAIAETAEYTKRFDSKLAELLPIAQAIQAAVEQANQNTSTSSGSVGFGDYAGPDSNSSGSFGGSIESQGAMPAALGAVMKYGRVMAYANGGIPDYVNSPTLAPMALFGEAGPEAIMPLRRGPDGRLGVEVNGSDNQAVVSELRAVRDEIVSLREATVDSDGNESTGLVEAIAELRVQVGGLREELRTARLRAQ
jgi:tape measure domain-containing protein